MFKVAFVQVVEVFQEVVAFLEICLAFVGARFGVLVVFVFVFDPLW